MSRENYSIYSLYEICALDRKLLCFYPDNFIYTDNEKMGDSKTHLSGLKFNLFVTALIQGTFYPSYRQT